MKENESSTVVEIIDSNPRNIEEGAITFEGNLRRTW